MKRKGLNRGGRRRIRVWVLLILALWGCAWGGGTSQPLSTHEAMNQSKIEVKGLFSVIRNGHVEYRLYSEDGRVYRLVIPAPLLEQAGGVLALQNQRVWVKGSLQRQEDHEVISVLEIRRLP